MYLNRVIPDIVFHRLLQFPKGTVEYVISAQDSKMSKFNCPFERIFALELFTIFGIPSKIFSAIEQRFEICKVGADFSSSRLKLYIPLYGLDFKKSMRTVLELKKIIGSTDTYQLEDSFVEFDCIGVDISPDGGVSVKVYELIREHRSDFLQSHNLDGFVRHYGIMKSENGRKKSFFRFSQGLEFGYFEEEFGELKFDDIFDKVIEKKVKYYCEEGIRKEIYFI